jgi:hypothetical protein
MSASSQTRTASTPSEATPQNAWIVDPPPDHLTLELQNDSV